MSGERFTLRRGLTSLELPGQAIPEGNWGETYDLKPASGVHSSVFWIEGTGQPVPTVLALSIPIAEATEQASQALIDEIVVFARTATALSRTGHAVVGLLGLQSWGQQATDPGDSSQQLLTLNLMRAAVGQAVTAPGDPAYIGSPGTATTTIDGVTYSVEVINYDQP